MTPFNHHPKVSMYECRCKNCGWTSHEILQHRIWAKKTYRHKPMPAYKRFRGGGKMARFMAALKPSAQCPAYKRRRLSREKMTKILVSFKAIANLRV
jgi:hypothetical protein